MSEVDARAARCIRVGKWIGGPAGAANLGIQLKILYCVGFSIGAIHITSGTTLWMAFAAAYGAVAGGVFGAILGVLFGLYVYLYREVEQ
jgi:hypothetical protein